MNLSLLDLWNQMGPFAKGIVFVLAIMSVWSLSISIKKWWDLRAAQAETRKFAPEFSQFLEEDNLGEAVGLAEKYKKSQVEREMLMTVTDLKRGLGILATVGATAPFVGLLGTTMGIVNAFVGMAASGSGGLSAISAGVAEALVTTAFGLMVAIPAVWAFNFFQVKIDNLTAEMTYTSKEMIDYMIKNVSGEFGRSRFTREFNTTASTAASGPISQ